MKKKKN